MAAWSSPPTASSSLLFFADTGSLALPAARVLRSRRVRPQTKRKRGPCLHGNPRLQEARRLIRPADPPSGPERANRSEPSLRCGAAARRRRSGRRIGWRGRRRRRSRRRGIAAAARRDDGPHCRHGREKRNNCDILHDRFLLRRSQRRYPHARATEDRAHV